MNKFLDYIETRLEFLWQRAEESANNDVLSLSWLRIFYALYIIVFNTPNFSWIGEVPQSLFLPPLLSFAYLFNGFPSYYLLLMVDLILVVCALCLLLGIKARYAGIVFSLFFIIGSSFQYSFGKIDHPIMFPVFIFGLSFTNWGVNNALVSDRELSPQLQSKILAILAVILCFGMFTAGLDKALYWVDFDPSQGGFLHWFYAGFFNNGRDYLLAPFVTYLPPQTYEILDYVAVFFELTPFIALLAGKRWWLLWLFVASTFHLGNTLLLNINFPTHAPVYLTFVPISLLVFQTIPRYSNKLKAGLVLLGISLAIIAHHIIYFIKHNSFGAVFNYALPLFQNKVELLLYASLIIWAITIPIIGLAVLKTFINSKPSLSNIKVTKNH